MQHGAKEWRPRAQPVHGRDDVEGVGDGDVEPGFVVAERLAEEDARGEAGCDGGRHLREVDGGPGVFGDAGGGQEGVAEEGGCFGRERGGEVVEGLGDVLADGGDENFGLDAFEVEGLEAGVLAEEELEEERSVVPMAEEAKDRREGLT